MAGPKTKTPKASRLVSIACVLPFSTVNWADNTLNFQNDLIPINNRQIVTNESYTLAAEPTESGIKIGLSVTSIYQQNIHGGLSTHRRSGRHSGSYDLEITAHMDKILGMERSKLFVHTEGWWSKSMSIDGPSVGSLFGINADALPTGSMVVTEFWYEQAMFDGTFLLRAGKMDVTRDFECSGCPVAFDTSSFANDETTQFLNGALVNNPTIPFPDDAYALGIAGYYNPFEWWYTSIGAFDAQSNVRETGLRTALYREDYFFYIFETGVTILIDSANGPLQGAYRMGVWNDPQPRGHSDSIRRYRDDVGFYVSFEQMLTKEDTTHEDNQGLGMFLRYGHADAEKNDVTNFWSVGFQYQGLLDGRQQDVFGAGFAQGFLSNAASATYPEDYESVIELYYNVRINPHIHLSPDFQYIINPGGADVRDAIILGMRMQMLF